MGSTTLEITKTNKSGCGFSFMNERREIVDAARAYQGAREESTNRRTSSMTTTTMTMTIPSDMLVDDDIDTSPPSDFEIQDMLDRTTDQLHSKNDSAVIFALQNLYSMTTPDQYNCNTATQVSKYVVENHNGIRDIVASIYVGRVGNMTNERSEQICNLSLEILINGMKTLTTTTTKNKKNCYKNSILDYQCKHFVEMLVPALVVAVTNYDKNAHTACLAMNCLCLMATSSSFARTKIGEASTRKTVEEAKAYGSIEHLRLEEAAYETLQTQLITA